MDIKERQRQHPDYRKLSFAGSEWEFFLSAASLEQARQEGIDPLAGLDADGEAVPMRAYAQLLHTGIRTFHGDDELSVEDIYALLSIGDVLRLQQQLTFLFPEQENGSAGGGTGKE